MSFDVRWFSYLTTPEINDAIGEYVSSRVFGVSKPFFLSSSMGVFENGNLLAGMVYHNYDAGAGVIEISGAADSPRWLGRPVLKQMFEYPFKQLGCQAVVMRVDSNNARLGRMLPAYGFMKYEIPRLRGRDRSETIYVLHDDVWMTNKFNKE